MFERADCGFFGGISNASELVASRRKAGVDQMRANVLGDGIDVDSSDAFAGVKR